MRLLKAIKESWQNDSATFTIMVLGWFWVIVIVVVSFALVTTPETL